MSVSTLLRIASFDAGGARSISQLEIMKHIMDQASRMRYPDDHDKVILPCEQFDVIGGTETGGLIAIMLTKLRMSVEEAITELRIIIEKVYTNKMEPADKTQRLRGCVETLLTKRHLPVYLEMEFEPEMIHAQCTGLVLTERMNDGCKLFLKTRWPRYDFRSITVVEAVLATCASQPDFLPVSLDWHPDGPHQYVSPRASNPLHQVITEALSISHSRSVESSIVLLLSLGFGGSGMISSTRSHHSSLHEQHQDMTQDKRAGQIHEQVEKNGSYFRFLLPPDMQGSGFDTDVEELGRIMAQTDVYLRNPDTVKRIEDCVNVMTDVSTDETLALHHYTAGRYREAEALQEGVWLERSENLGDVHPDTIRASENLVMIRLETMEWSMAVSRQEDVLGYRKVALGMDHPRSIEAATTLALIQSESEDWGKAEELQLEILEQKRRLFGNDHSETIRAAANLASTYHIQGKWNGAKRLRLEILERQRRILGEDHPEAILAVESLDATLRAPKEVKAARLWESTLRGTLQEPVSASPGAREDALLDTSSSSTAIWDLGGLQSKSVALDTSVGYSSMGERHLQISEAVRRCYHEGSPLAKQMEERNTLRSTGHPYRVQLVPLNFELLETSMTVDQNSTLSQVGFRLHVSSTAAMLPVALEQTSGPFPRWRIPDINSRIPRGLQKIFVADINEPFTLALIRDVDEDFPLLLPLASFDTGATSVSDLIEARLGRGKSWASVRLLSSSSDIQSVPCDVIRKGIKGVYSTTILVLLSDDPLSYKFRKDHVPSPLPLKMAFLQCQNLVDIASHMDAFALEAVHLSRALLHLIICLAEAVDLSLMEETIEAHHISRLRRLVVKLKSIFAGIEGLTDGTFESIRASLVQFYNEICEERPGAVAIRQSLESLQALTVLDLRNQGRSSEIPNMTLTIQEEDYLEDQGFIRDMTSERRSGSNESASSDSLSSSGQESDASSERAQAM